MMSRNWAKLTVPIWLDVIWQNDMSWLFSSFTSAPPGSWFVLLDHGVISWIRRTVWVRSQGEETLAEGALAECTNRPVMPIGPRIAKITSMIVVALTITYASNLISLLNNELYKNQQFNE